MYDDYSYQPERYALIEEQELVLQLIFLFYFPGRGGEAYKVHEEDDGSACSTCTCI